MSNKTRTVPPSASKAMKTKRPSTVSVASTSSRGKISATTSDNSRPKSNKNTANTTINTEKSPSPVKQDGSKPDFDAERRQIAYGKFLRSMLEDCLVEDKIALEETQMDMQMAQLVERFQKTVEQLDKTSKRLKDISFVVEQKRLLDLKNQDVSRFYEITNSSNAEDLLNNLSSIEAECLDKLETKNIDFGYNKDSGHKQLLDAVNDAIDGLEQIKKHSNLDIDKFKEYEKSEKNMQELEKDRFSFESLKAEFDEKFPKFSEMLIKETSEKISDMMTDDDEEDDD